MLGTCVATEFGSHLYKWKLEFAFNFALESLDFGQDSNKIVCRLSGCVYCEFCTLQHWIWCQALFSPYSWYTGCRQASKVPGPHLSPVCWTGLQFCRQWSMVAVRNFAYEPISRVRKTLQITIELWVLLLKHRWHNKLCSPLVINNWRVSFFTI
jgi:hypothetical protein